MRHGALTVLALVLLVAASAGAEHVYSHRYLLSGRILDADGDPVAGLAIPYGFTGFHGSDLCDGVPQRGVTSAYGDFSYCFHLHDLDKSDQISFAVKAGEVRRQVNLLTRWTHENVRATNASLGSEPPADFHRSYSLSGKVWQQTEPGRLDKVYVYGVALEGVNVTVLARDSATNETVAANATTDAYGEYAVDLLFSRNLTGGRVTIAALGHSLEVDLDPFFMKYRQDLRVPGNASHPRVEPGEPPLPSGSRDPARGVAIANFPDNSPETDAPGSEAPGLSGGPIAVGVLALSVGGIGVAMWTLARRERD